jgi:hypothetical protein
VDDAVLHGELMTGVGKNIEGQPDHASAAQPTVALVVTRGLRAYTKLAIHVLFTLLGTIWVLIDKGGDAAQWVQVVSQVVVIAGIYMASNTVPGAKYAKATISAIAAALTILIPAILGAHEPGDGFSTGTVVNMVIAVLGSLGVVTFADKTPDGQNVIELAERLRSGNAGLAAA